MTLIERLNRVQWSVYSAPCPDGNVDQTVCAEAAARIAELEAVVAADLALLDHCAHLHFGAMINPKRDIHDAALGLKPLMDACYAARRAALGKDRAG